MPSASAFIRFNFGFGALDSDGDIVMPGAFNTGKKKINIAPGPPINTSVFEEAIVLEENGVLTKEGIKEYAGQWVSEDVYKPLIDFLNR